MKCTVRLRRMLSGVVIFMLLMGGLPATAFADGSQTSPSNKEAFTEIANWMDEQDELDYILEPWTNLKTVVENLRTKLENQENDITDTELSNVQTLRNYLDYSYYQVNASYESKFPLDGYYALPLSVKSVPLSYNVNSDVRPEIQRVALAEVKDGQVRVTLRVGGFEHRLQGVAIATSKGYKYASGFRFTSLIFGSNNFPKEFPTEYETAAKSAMTTLGYYDENLDSDWWREDVTVEVNENLGYADVTFELNNIAEDVYFCGLHDSTANYPYSSHNNKGFIYFDQEKMRPLPLTLEEVSDWGFELENTFSVISYNKTTGLSTVSSLPTVIAYNRAKSFFDSIDSVTVEDGKISAVFTESIESSLGAITYAGQMNKKTINTSSKSTVLRLSGTTRDDYTPLATELTENESTKFSIDFPLESDDSFYKALVFGRQIVLHGSGETVAASTPDIMTAIRLVPGKLQSIELTDADTDVEFHSDTYNVPDSSTFTAPNITEENTGQYMNFYNYITTQYASTYHRWQAWETFVFGNLGGRIVNLQKNAEFRLPLNGYDPDNIDVFFYNTKSIIPAIENIKGHAEGNYYVVQAPVATMFLMCEKKPKGDGASLAEGFYSVDVSVWHYTNYVNGQTSMANGAMVNPAQLAVRGDGSRTLYLGVKSLTISGFQGYLSHMWVGDGAGGVTPVTVSEYYKDANGSYYIDEIARDMGVPYPKYVYFDLPSAEDRIHARFQAPIMDALAGGQPSPQDAWLQIEYGTAEQINEITLPQSEVFVDEPAANKTALSSALTVAKTITKGNKVDSAWENLQAAIADAQTVYDRGDVTQVQVDNALSALNLAVGAFYAAETVGGGTLDKDNLADGSYVLNADMIHMNRNQKSMADGAIDHNVKLTVEGGAYYLTVDFHGLTVPLGNQSFFGYLKDLKYYDAGFTYNYGALVGATKPATVLDSYENVVDQYNDVSPKDGVPDYKYPKTLKFPLVNKAGYVDNYVPLQVFVPIMEAISTGSGTQDVLMRLDWSSLRLPGAVLPDPTYTDPNTGITIEAGGGALPDGAKFDVAPVAPGADAYARGKDILADVGTKFALYDISLSSSNVKVQPNGTVKVSLPVPAGMNAGRVAVYRIEDSGAKTLLTSEVSGGNLSFYTDHFSLFAIVERAEEAGQTWIPSTGSPMPASSVAVASALTSLSSLKIVASDKVWTGKKIATGFVLAVGGKKLSAGKDYSIKSTGANKNIGAGTVKIAGKGGYTGAATVKFKIVPKAVSVKSAKAGVKALALSFAKAPKAEKITKYEVRWRVKGAKSWSAPKAVSPAKAALTVNQLKKGKSYDVQARVYKTVSGSKYYSEWSKVKASAKVL